MIDINRPAIVPVIGPVTVETRGTTNGRGRAPPSADRHRYRFNDGRSDLNATETYRLRISMNRFTTTTERRGQKQTNRRSGRMTKDRVHKRKEAASPAAIKDHDSQITEIVRNQRAANEKKYIWSEIPYRRRAAGGDVPEYNGGVG
ncbi:hypothetical protein EVAR_99629_1 [Eumeta japonica]|uniref:Uncharacterized protein n=1 Tax=Eumeta variegata TaxID=151549 RepID=A0A4C1ZZY6_EUMVA|nr:hypothetical protein EVAR_99629_1 [Eumeta japonica]